MTNVRKALIEIGFDDSLVGTRIVEQAVGIVVKDPGAARLMMADVFIPAARKLGVNDSGTCISRNINYAIGKATLRRDFGRLCERLEKKYGAEGLFGLVITDNGRIAPKKLVMKLATLFGDDWDKEV